MNNKTAFDSSEKNGISIFGHLRVQTPRVCRLEKLQAKQRKPGWDKYVGVRTKTVSREKLCGDGQRCK